MREHRALLPVTATILLFAHAPVPPWALWVVAVITGVIVAVRRREALGWAVALAITWFCAILLFATDWAGCGP